MSSKTAKTSTITPLGDRVLLRRVEAEERTKGGIVLPDTAKEKPREGIVVAVGKGRMLDSGERVPFTVKARDRILFSSYAGTEIKIEGEEYLILGEDEILAVLD
jgi:chaperonin GroES